MVDEKIGCEPEQPKTWKENVDGVIVDCSEAVSYTHLDVYKRQAWSVTRRISSQLHQSKPKTTIKKRVLFWASRARNATGRVDSMRRTSD